MSNNNSELRTGDIVLDTYEVLGLIGRGGMGSVYRVYQRFLKKEMAMKTMHANTSDHVIWRRFQLEAQSLAKLIHPNIVQIFDLGALENNQLYYCMEILEGKGLDYLISHRLLSIEQSLIAFRQVASALAFTHERGIIHRDIKPANIVVLNNSQPLVVKVVDFGIARLLASEQGLTQTGEIFGSPLYMSPEQARGEKVDCRSDIYSLGCSFYEALTGSPPLKGKTAMDTLMLHQEQTPQPIESLRLDLNFPCGLSAAIQKMLAKKIEDRYQNASQVAHDLQLISLGQGDRVEARLQALAADLRNTPGTTQAARANPHPPKDIGIATTFSQEELFDKEIKSNHQEDFDEDTHERTPLPKLFALAALAIFLLAGLSYWAWHSTAGSKAKENTYDELYKQVTHYKLNPSEVNKLQLSSRQSIKSDYYLFASAADKCIGQIGIFKRKEEGEVYEHLTCVGLVPLKSGSRLSLSISPYLAKHPELLERFNKEDLLAVDFPYFKHKNGAGNNAEDDSYKDAKITMQFLRTLHSCPNLARLNTSDTKLNAECFNELSKFSNLEILDSSGSKVMTKLDNVKLKALPNLHELSLPSLLENDLAVILTNLTMPEKINRLTIYELTNSEANLKAIHQFQNLQFFCCASSFIEAPLLEELIQMKNLKEIDFRRSDISADDIPLLLQIKTESITLSSAIVEKWGQENFARFKADFPGKLELVDVEITNF